MTSPVTDASIIADLAARSHQDTDYQLLQFRSLVTAHQYLRLYEAIATSPLLGKF